MMDYCKECGRVGDDIGQCGRTTMPCPTPQDIATDKVAVVSCGPCGKVLAFPVADLIKGLATGGSKSCVLDQCAATLVLPAVPEQKTRTVTKEVIKEVTVDSPELIAKAAELEATLATLQERLSAAEGNPAKLQE